MPGLQTEKEAHFSPGHTEGFGDLVWLPSGAGHLDDLATRGELQELRGPRSVDVRFQARVEAGQVGFERAIPFVRRRYGNA